MPIKERTVTETALESAASSRPAGRVAGAVVLFRQTPCTPVAHRITAPQTFGRGDEAGVTIDDAALSRLHARFEPASGGLRITDLGSRNGSFVDGDRVAEEGSFAPFGSLVRVGKTLLLVTEDVSPFEMEVENPYPALVGGPSLADVRHEVATMARSPLCVLMEGETGTGKEVVSRALHEASRRTGTFAAVNCAALSRDLVESELFGHAKGAFSGSTGARPGVVRAAEHGTLLLDEIGELPLAAQAKLLRFIETGEIRGVGEDVDTRVDVRIIAATNRDLFEMAEQGTFRTDLLYRIAAVRIHLPALRDRLEDIPRLCAHFLADEGALVSVGAVFALMRRRWPGNLRELRNALLAAAAVAKRAGRTEVRAEDVKPSDDADDDAPASERARVMHALAAANGNVSRAAKDLGMARSGLYEMLRRLNLDPARFRGS